MRIFEWPKWVYGIPIILFFQISKVIYQPWKAAIVKTLTQVNNIQLVEFYINDQPLIGADEKPVGLMSPNDFVVSPSSLQAEQQQVSLKLYIDIRSKNRFYM